MTDLNALQTAMNTPTNTTEVNVEKVVEVVEETKTAETDAIDNSGEENKTLTVEELNAEVAKWKHFSRKREGEVNAYKKDAEAWNEYKKSQLTKEEQLSEELNSLRAEVASTKKEALLQKVISDKKLPEKAIPFLIGDTEDELNTRADELLTLLGVSEVEPKVTKPSPNPFQGVKSDEVTTKLSGLQALEAEFNKKV